MSLVLHSALGDGGLISTAAQCHADTTPPAITCPASIVKVEVGTAEDIAATATDASGDPSITCLPNTALLPVGADQAVVCTAHDVSGNSQTCTAQVTVEGALAVLINWLV